MHQCGWLDVALAALFLVGPSASSPGESGPSNPEMQAAPSSKLATTCYFGSPSESCTFTCSQNSMDAYCDEVKKQCVCKDREIKEELPESVQAESDEPDEEPNDDKAQQITPVTAKPKTNFGLSDICVLGRPTPICISRCNRLSLKSYCDEKLSVCQCRNPPEEDGFNMDWLKLLINVMGGYKEVPLYSPDLLEQLTGSSSGINPELFNLWLRMQSGLINDSQDNEEEISDDVPSEQDDTRHYVFYIFDLDKLFNETDDISILNTTEVPSTHPVLHHIGKAIEGWALTHVLAVVLIVFLFGLLLLELAFCIKKEKSDDQMQTIFPTKK